jgi:capsid protein
MSQFVGSTDHRLFADWQTRLEEPLHVWSREFMPIASRAVSLVSNDPFAAAMVNAKIRETHGPQGMRLRSTYSETGGSTTSTSERKSRREIEAFIARASCSTHLDAGGELTTADIDTQMDWIATVMGDAWAVWVWKPGRPGAILAGCWRIVTPDRVENPNQQPNNDRLQNGCELDEDGRLIAIHVRMGNIGPYGIATDLKWKRVEIYGKDGMRQVLHRVGIRVPGMLRGVSMFAPALLLMRQIQGTIEAHVAGKRAQAIHPIIYFTEDEDELKAATAAKSRLGHNAVLGPMSILVAKYGATDVKFMQSNFQGSDLRDFLTTMYRSLTAMWGYPWQVVLAEMGEASLASARAGLDQADRTSDKYAKEHQEQVSRPRDEAILREGAARKEISFKSKDWSQIAAGRYTRPPKYSTDRLKDANTIEKLIAAKVSPSTAFEMFGLNYEDEAEQSKADEDFALAQGLDSPLKLKPQVAPAAATPAPTNDDNAETDGTEEPADEADAEDPATTEETVTP